MKKQLLLLCCTLLLNTLVAAENSPEFSNALERTVTEQVMPFANNRVKQMCKEWPTCTEWVNSKVRTNPSFQLLDAEVANWVSRPQDGPTDWNYLFYVQTRENGQTGAYQFKRNSRTSYAEPVKIKKFPGHPVPGKPSEHIGMHKPIPDHGQYPDYEILCASWPGCRQWVSNHSVHSALIGQYIYKWDENSNALWKRVLYVRAVKFFSAKNAYFQAYQTTANGAYTYQTPTPLNACPAFPDF